MASRTEAGGKAEEYLYAHAVNVNLCVYYYLRTVLFLVLLQTYTFVHHRFPYTPHPFFVGVEVKHN